MLNFDEFVINLDSKTAILFLGQKYDDNKLIELLPKQYTIRKEGGQRKYCEMLDNFVSLCKEGKPKDEILHDIKIAETKIIDDRFAKLLRLPWNGIVTSLVHGAPGFNELIEVTQLSDVKKDYYSAQKRKITYLYGKAQKEDGIRIFPLSSEEKITSRNIKCRLWENILERIAMRGVLVVDSWDPAEDWLQASDFSLLIDAPKESVYFFNISEETQNNEIISCLIEKGIAVNVPSSLYDFCQYDDNEYSYDETEYDEASYCYFTISSQLDTRKRSVKKIEKNILYQLDSYIHVLDDSVLNSPNIMAAGIGSRISRNIDRPKSLLEIEGKSILRRTIEMLLANDIKPAVIGGYMHEQIEENLAGLDVKLYYNPFYRVTNSLGSLWFARDFIDDADGLLLANADVFWEQELLDMILAEDKEAVMLADSSAVRLAEGDYFFGCEDNKIVKYGKELAESIRTHEYVGVAKLEKEFLPTFKNMMYKMIEDEKYSGWWENILYALSSDHDVYVKDVDGIFWAEVDFIEDYERIMDYVWSKKGLTKGIEQLTRNMMREGCSLDLIARVTGLSEEKLRMLQ